MSSSWLEISPDSDFSLKNIPFGVFSHPNGSKRCATALGDHLIDLSVLEEAGCFEDIEGLPANIFNQKTLNAFVALPRSVWIKVRKRIQELFQTGNGDYSLENNKALQKAALHPLKDDRIIMHLPVEIGDYTDFYSSREHATNVGTMFRGKDNALQPNWLHLPVGYHGRSSTVVPSGHPVHRPFGQLQKDPNDASQGSIYGPCKLLDFELEVAFVVGGPPNELGHSLSMDRAKERIFGFCLMNDWSARDVQKFEYVPLGPFTSKNWATTISPWLVTAIALEEGGLTCQTSAVKQDPEPLPYLVDPTYSSYDIDLSVSIQSENMSAPATICKSNFKNLYWNAAQQLVHHSVTGCIMKPGDLLGSGTISGSTEDSFGSMLELSWKGTKEVKLGDSGEIRKFLQDGDTVIMKGLCQGESNGRIGFGECSGKILPRPHDVGQGTFTTPEKPAKEERYQGFKLYGYWKSTSTWRVRIALAAKDISYEIIPINIFAGEQNQPSFREVNALGQVPVLEFTDIKSGQGGSRIVRLSQSIAIIEFLDQAFPDKRSLFPTDALGKATAYEMIEVINSGTQPLQNLPFLHRLEKQSEQKIVAMNLGKEMVERGLSVLEKLVMDQNANIPSEKRGPYCLGTFSPSVVDAFMVPQLANAKRFSVDIDKVCPTLARIFGECEGHKWFQAARPEDQPDSGT